MANGILGNNFRFNQGNDANKFWFNQGYDVTNRALNPNAPPPTQIFRQRPTIGPPILMSEVEQQAQAPQGFRQRAAGLLQGIGSALRTPAAGLIQGIGSALRAPATGLVQGVGSALRDPNVLDQLTIGFAGMSTRPNQALIQQASNRIQQRQELAAKQQEIESQMQQVNRTAEYFRSIERPDLAQAIENNPQAANAILQEYIASTFEPQEEQETYSVLTADQIEQYGLEPGRSYKRNNLTGEISTIGSAGPTFNIGGEKQQFSYDYLSEQYGTAQAAATNSQRILDDVDLVARLISASDLSAAEALIASTYPDLSNLLQQGGGKVVAARSIINALAPKFRESGSGSTSDAEMRQYIQALPSFTASDEGNLLTVEIFRAKAEKDQQRATIMNDWAIGRIDDSEALDSLNRLNTESIFTPEVRRRINNIYPQFFDEVTFTEEVNY